MRKPVYIERVELCLSKKLKKDLEKAANESKYHCPITVNELIRRILESWTKGECY